jgi:hypothetical protein
MKAKLLLGAAGVLVGAAFLHIWVNVGFQNLFGERSKLVVGFLPVT